MKDTLPEGHGLSDELLARTELLPQVGDTPLITDVQFDALAVGVARGMSLLVSAPTSTGKTLIGWWATATSIVQGRTTVYLVSHRALAKQKFDEAKRLFLSSHLDGDASTIVCATGDSVEDAAGRKTNAPLSSSILVATYEKFLGLLSVGGPPRDLSNICFICDEVQLVGDAHRGQSTELLLTLLRRAGWHQFLGLSAVLSESDAAALADWLGVRLVRNPTREKALTIECRSAGSTLALSVGPNYDGTESEEPAKQHRTVDAMVLELLQQKKSPVIVFCMKVDDTYTLSGRWSQSRAATEQVNLTSGVEIELPLIDALKRRTAYHNAELTEDERLFVEDRLANGLVDVVFATTTLAAGVNFPLGSAVFASWNRWNFDRKTHEPISRAEFQNMAGRVGRMGQAFEQGYVLFAADGAQELRQARKLIATDSDEVLGFGISPDDFGSLTLQLFAGKLCNTREDAFELLGSTLTASRELSRNRAGIDHWKGRFFKQIDRLVSTGCLHELHGQVSVTTFGIAVAQSGLKPETALHFIEGLKKNSVALQDSLKGGGAAAEDDFLFIVCHAALRSPEFGVIGGKATRTLNWRIGRNGPVTNPRATRLNSLLTDQPWVADAGAANAALQLAEWGAGTARAEIERIVRGVRLGTVQGVARDVAWVLSGLAEIISAITSPALADESKPEVLRGGSADTNAVRQLSAVIRRQAVRIGTGLPSAVLWMSELRLQGPQVRLRRDQVISLHNHGMTRPFDLMDGSEAADEKRKNALGLADRGGFANLVRNAARAWRQQERQHCRSIHIRRGDKLSLGQQIKDMYDLRGSELESAFEASLASLGIPFDKLDRPGRPGYPDYLISIEQFVPVVFEIKSKQSDHDFVPLNAATEVLSASELAGFKDHPCVTLCSPSLDPSIPSAIEAARRLTVIDTSDFCEALLRMHEGSLTRDGFYNWLTTPGLALSETLPHPL